MNIAITNAWILTLKENKLGIIKNGAVGIEGNRISYIGSSDGLNPKEADLVIDGTKHLVMPGLVNTHIHTSMQLLKGGAQDLPEIEWMNKGIGPLAKHLTNEDIMVGSRLGVLEGIRTGTTTFSEYARDVENLVENVYLNIGARVVATETINEVSQDNRAELKPTDLYEFDKKKGSLALSKNDQLFKKYKNNPLVSCLYGPQALDMVSLETIHAIKEKATSENSKLHMHVAQGGRERLQITGRFGKDSSTVKVLHEQGLLGDFLIAAHCHDTSYEEKELMVKSGAKMVGCPSSISMIDGIVPPIYEFYKLGGDVGIATDQAPGTGNHNLFREMRTISILTKAQFQDPTLLPAWETLQIATIKGAKVLGLGNEIGTLEVGKKADIITINLNNFLLTPVVDKPFHTFIPNLVYSGTGLEVDNVIIDGRLIFSDNCFQEINEEKLISEANNRAIEIFQNASEDWKKADSKMVKDVEKGLL